MQRLNVTFGRIEFLFASMLDLFVALPAVALLLCWVWRRIDFERRRKAFSRDHGCLPPVNASRFDPILGIYHTFNIARASAKGRHLQNLHDNLFSKYGNSFSMLVMGQPILLTNDPRNLQAILATQFGDFEIGTRRRDVMADLLGVGIFNADGDAWAHARATIRPNLTRKQFTDVVLFEKHFQVWMNHMPVGQGKLLDVQEWVFRFVSHSDACNVYQILTIQLLRLLTLAPSFYVTNQPTRFIPKAPQRDIDLDGLSTRPATSSQYVCNSVNCGVFMGVVIIVKLAKLSAITLTRWCTRPSREQNSQSNLATAW